MPLIIELINEVVQKQLCYLGEVSKHTTVLISERETYLAKKEYEFMI